jgi:tetratricopeptide (TPR) repeat protein
MKISTLPVTPANGRAAIILHETFVEKYPDFSTAWYVKGLALSRLRIYDEAMNCFGRSIKNDPKAAGASKSHNINVAANK